IICNTAGSARREQEYVHMLLERRVDGMIFICSEITDVRGEHSHYQQLLDQGARLVFVNGDAVDLDITSIGVDERAAGRLATEHLLALGHRRIGFVAGFEYASPTRDKARGREDALHAAGVDPNGLVAHADFTVDGGRTAMRKLLRHARGRPTAVICSNDLMAIGAIHETWAHGMNVPNDLSVVGFDGTDLANWVEPRLTTVEQPIPDLASAAIGARAGERDPDREVVSRLPPEEPVPQPGQYPLVPARVRVALVPPQPAWGSAEAGEERVHRRAHAGAARIDRGERPREPEHRGVEA